MGSPSELSLDYKPAASGYHSMAPKPFGDQPHDHDQAQKLEEFLSRLEEERLKIDVLKREFPLCMQLLNNAMEAYRQQLETCHFTNQGGGPKPIHLEEFIPLKLAGAGSATVAVEESGRSSSTAPASVTSEKASWMTSAQLWSPLPSDGKQPPATKLALESKRRSGGAFLPFCRDHQKGIISSAPARGAAGNCVVPVELALGSPESTGEEEMIRKSCAGEEPAMRSRRERGGGGVEQGKDGTAAAAAEGQTAAAQAHRKARRCWSPDLHRRFVNALQMLGGSQVATPKQIRELMKVDGLTNDEVKSHLQKYRLHTRRPIPAPQQAAGAPQLLVLGGIWVPPEYATTAAGTAIYGAHPGPTHYCAAPVPHHDFYPAPPPHHQHQHQHHQQTSHHRGTAVAYKGKHESPESEVRGSREQSESMEDGEEEEEEEVEEKEGEEEECARSESNSWKGGGEEKALVSVRDDGGEDSNGSGVTLKF